MSEIVRLTDDAIRAALSLPSDLRAPNDLADGIMVAVAATPQRGASWLGWRPTRRQRFILRMSLVIALLALAATAVLLLIGSRLVPPTTPPTTSTYHGGPARDGVMPGPAPSGTPRIAWAVDAKGPFGSWSPVVSSAGLVYAGDQNGFVTALDEATGGLRWQRSLGAPDNGGLTLTNGLIIAGDDAGIVHALDAVTGTERWNYRALGPVHSAAIASNGLVIEASLGGELVALDAVTGKLVWSKPSAGPVSRTIAEVGDTIFTGSGGATPSGPGTLAAWDSATGEPRWAASLDPGNTTTVTVSDGRVFVGEGLDLSPASVHHVEAFDAKTGARSWATPFAAPTGKILLIGAAAGGSVYVTAIDGNMYVLDAASGRIAWQASIGSNQSPNGAMVDGVLFISSDDRRIHAFDIASHAAIWQVPVKGVPGAPAIVDGQIFVETSVGQIVRLVGG
jgi:outer membrane protein assembly factor BamB